MLGRVYMTPTCDNTPMGLAASPPSGADDGYLDTGTVVGVYRNREISRTEAHLRETFFKGEELE